MNQTKPDTATGKLLSALTQATRDGQLPWRQDAKGRPLTQGDTLEVTLEEQAPGQPAATLTDRKTGHNAQARSASFPVVNGLLEAARDDARHRRDCIAFAIQELQPQQFPEENDADGSATLVRALAYATRNHSISWARLQNGDYAAFTAQAFVYRCHLLANADTLILLITAEGEPFCLRTETRSAECRLSPLNELLECLRLAKTETARDMLQQADSTAHDEILTHLLAGII